MSMSISISSSIRRLSPPPAAFLPPSSSRRTTTAVASTTSSSSSSNHSDDVAIVGCGVLGTSLCEILLSHPSFASRNIVGITKGTSRHDDIRRNVGLLSNGDIGRSGNDDGGDGSRFELLTMEDAMSLGRKYRDVVFCAPPSGFDDYPSAIDIAANELWSRHGIVEDDDGESGGTTTTGGGGGSFVFTSSGVVYGDGSGDVVNELSSTNADANNPRVSRMLNAERNALSRGGCALRLAGLYALERGAHNYWLEKFGTGTKGGGSVQGRGDGIVNLLHYDDAASAVLAALIAGPDINSGKIFLISDGNPSSRRGICESALKHPRYDKFHMPSFASDDDDDDDKKRKDEGVVGGRSNNARGKVYDGRWSNQALRWTPTYASFDEFMTSSSSDAAASSL